MQYCSSCASLLQLGVVPPGCQHQTTDAGGRAAEQLQGEQAGAAATVPRLKRELAATVPEREVACVHTASPECSHVF